MKFKSTFAAISLAAALSTSLNVNATGIPTVDLANLVPSLSNAIANLESQIIQYEGYVKQVEDLQNQYNQLVELREQVITAKENLSSITGVRDIGKILNNPLLKEYRATLPSEWQDDIDFSIGIVNESNRALNQYERTQSRLRFQEAFKEDNWINTSSEEIKSYRELASSTFQFETVANASLETSKKTTENVEKLLEEIDKTQDLKGSQDLTNRLMSENLTLTNKLIQLQSASAMGSASKENFNFNQKINEKKFTNTELPDFSEIRFEGLRQ